MRNLYENNKSILLCELSQITEMSRDFLLECGHVVTALQDHTHSLFLEPVHALNLLLVAGWKRYGISLRVLYTFRYKLTRFGAPVTVI